MSLTVHAWVARGRTGGAPLLVGGLAARTALRYPSLQAAWCDIDGRPHRESLPSPCRATRHRSLQPAAPAPDSRALPVGAARQSIRRRRTKPAPQPLGGPASIGFPHVAARVFTARELWQVIPEEIDSLSARPIADFIHGFLRDENAELLGQRIPLSGPIQLQRTLVPAGLEAPTVGLEQGSGRSISGFF